VGRSHFALTSKKVPEDKIWKKCLFWDKLMMVIVRQLTKAILIWRNVNKKWAFACHELMQWKLGSFAMVRKSSDD